MPSVFEDTTMKLAKNIGDRELKPVKCLLDATKIRQFSLIRRNKSRSLFWKPPDVPLHVSLMDVLEPSASVPDAGGKELFIFRDRVVKQQLAAGGVTAGPAASLSGEIAGSQGALLECQIVTHSNATWEDIRQRKLKVPEPSVLKQCRAAGANLYVVTETVQLVRGCVLEDGSRVHVQGKFSIPWNMFVKAEGQGGSRKESRRELTVPKGSVMAYKRKQLVFWKNLWGILHFVDDDKQETFPDFLKPTPQSAPITIETGGTGRFILIGFECLQQEIYQKVSVAKDLKDIQHVVFSSIRAILGDREALQDLMDKLEQEPLGHMDGPGGTILNELQKDSSSARVNSVDLLLYLLEGIMVLSDTQRALLAESMERKVLAQQRKLVGSILEPNFVCSQRMPFTLPRELLAPLQGENLAITYGLLDECGLKMERNSPQSTWEPEAKEPLCALYGTLSVLQQLAEA